MKILMFVVAGLFILMGLVWIGQGLSILPGTFMTGDVQWAVYGAIEAVLGIGLILIIRKMR